MNLVFFLFFVFFRTKKKSEETKNGSPVFLFSTCFLEHNCKTRENSNFWKKGKIIILVKIRNFSRPRMTKRISPLESFRKI